MILNGYYHSEIFLDTARWSETLNGAMVGPARKASWDPLFLNSERVQDSISGLVSLVRESVIVSEKEATGLR